MLLVYAHEVTRPPPIVNRQHAELVAAYPALGAASQLLVSVSSIRVLLLSICS